MIGFQTSYKLYMIDAYAPIRVLYIMCILGRS